MFFEAHALLATRADEEAISVPTRKTFDLSQQVLHALSLKFIPN